MSVQKNILEFHLGDWKKDFKKGIILEIQDRHPVILSKLDDMPSVIAKSELCDPLRQGISDIVERPIEHLDKKGELLQDSAVEMIRTFFIVGLISIRLVVVVQLC